MYPPVMKSDAAPPLRLARAFFEGNPAVVKAVKRPGIYQVRFCDRTETIRTLEGEVPAMCGDAVVTDGNGNQWPVGAETFRRKYAPLDGTVAGSDGAYRALPVDVRAVRVLSPFEVELVLSGAVLTGRPGDWLVDYGDGSLGVVASDIFEETYQVGVS